MVIIFCIQKFPDFIPQKMNVFKLSFKTGYVLKNKITTKPRAIFPN